MPSGKLFSNPCSSGIGGVSDFYTKEQINSLLVNKANTSTVYTRSYLDGQFSSVQGSLISLETNKISLSQLNSGLEDLSEEVLGTVSDLYALKTSVYTQSEVDSLIESLDLDSSSFIRTEPETSAQNTIYPGENDATALTLRGSSTNAFVQRWLSDNTDLIGYVSNTGSLYFERDLTLGRLVSEGGIALDLQMKRLGNLADPELLEDAVPYGFMVSYLTEVLENLGLGEESPVIPGTDIDYNSSTRILSSSTGTGTTLPLATTSIAGLMSGSDKTKLNNIASGAEVNVNADWQAVSGDALILNKPALGNSAALNVGVTAGTVAAGDDSRFTNSREWIAGTISVIEAEAGISTTRRAFTAQRVFQSVASWWSSSSAKTKLDGVEPGAQVNVPTDLSYTASSRLLISSTGTDVILPEVSSSSPGLMISSDKSKLDTVQSGAQVNVPTNLNYTAGIRVLSSSTGTSAILPEATTVIPGLLSSSDKTKLDSIESGAEINAPTDLSYTASTRLLSSSTGADVTLPEATTGLAGLMSNTDKLKLNGIESGAEVNLPTDLSYTASTRLLSSSTGADVTLPEVTTSDPGLSSAADKQKIDISIVSNVAGIAGSNAIINAVSLTQAQYTALAVKGINTLYIITD